MNRRSQYAKQKTAITFSYDTVVKQKLLHWTIFFLLMKSIQKMRTVYVSVKLKSK